MPSVAEALNHFEKLPVTWISRFRTKGKAGIIDTSAERGRLETEAVIVDAPLRVLQLLTDGTIGADVNDFYFAGVPLMSDGVTKIDFDDTLLAKGGEWTVRITGERTEGGYFKVTAKRSTRRALQP